MAVEHPTPVPGIFHLPLTGRRVRNCVVIGYTAVLDDEFTHTVLLATRWNVHRVYAVRATKPRVYLHRVIYEHYHGPIPRGLQVDHVNRNKLDNWPDNLRAVTGSINTANGDIRRNNTSGFRNVHWCARQERWQAKIMCRRKAIHLGYYLSKEDAARAVNAGYRTHFPEVPIPNPEAELLAH